MPRPYWKIYLYVGKIIDTVDTHISRTAYTPYLSFHTQTKSNNGYRLRVTSIQKQRYCGSTTALKISCRQALSLWGRLILATRLTKIPRNCGPAAAISACWTRHCYSALKCFGSMARKFGLKTRSSSLIGQQRFVWWFFQYFEKSRNTGFPSIFMKSLILTPTFWIWNRYFLTCFIVVCVRVHLPRL